MSIKLTDTQIVMLNAAAQRDDRCLVAPRNLKGGAAQKVAAKLIDGGLAKEIKAKPGAPVWRQDEQAGLSFALKLTAAGAKAIPIDDSSASDAMSEGSGGRVQAASSLKFPRRGTKIAGVIELLQDNDGVTLAELVANTGWLPHTARAALTGLRKRGYAVVIDRADKARGSVYRIEPSDMGGDSAAPQTATEATGKARQERLQRGARPRPGQAA